MTGLEISNIEYFVIAGYLALIISVGLVFKKFSSNTDDYFKGGSKGTWWLVGSSAFMSAFSAWTFTGAAGIAYEAGFTVMFIYIGNALGFFANYLFMGPWLRQMRVTTFPEAIAMRFGEKTQDFYALYEVPIRILYSAMALYGLGIFCSAVFGYDINHVIIACGIVVLLYSATGGRWAVMATDFLQGLILVPLTIIVAWLCLDKIGGIGNLFQQIEAHGLSEQYNHGQFRHAFWRCLYVGLGQCNDGETIYCLQFDECCPSLFFGQGWGRSTKSGFVGWCIDVVGEHCLVFTSNDGSYFVPRIGDEL